MTVMQSLLRLLAPPDALGSSCTTRAFQKTRPRSWTWSPSRLGIGRSLSHRSCDALDYLSPRKRICYFFERAVTLMLLTQRPRRRDLCLAAVLAGRDAEAVCLVDETSLLILAANHAVAEVVGKPVHELVNTPVQGLAATPQDFVFWSQPVQALAEGIHSETSVLHASGPCTCREKRTRSDPPKWA